MKVKLQTDCTPTAANQPRNFPLLIATEPDREKVVDLVGTEISFFLGQLYLQLDKNCGLNSVNIGWRMDMKTKS